MNSKQRNRLHKKLDPIFKFIKRNDLSFFSLYCVSLLLGIYFSKYGTNNFKIYLTPFFCLTLFAYIISIISLILLWPSKKNQWFPIVISCCLSCFLFICALIAHEYLQDSIYDNITIGACGTSLFWTILGLVSFLLHKSTRQYTEFIGATRHHSVIIVLSNAINSTKGCEIEKSIGSGTEFEIINKVNKFIYEHENHWFDVVSGLMDSMWKSTLPKFVIDFSPQLQELRPLQDIFKDYHNAVIVIVGSANKNTLRKCVLSQCLSHMMFQWENIGSEKPDQYFEELKKEPHFADIFNCVYCSSSSFTDTRITDIHTCTFDKKFNISIIEKVTTLEGNTFFCCAGARADDSYRAAAYLLTEWHKLPSADNFSICIGTKFSTKLLNWSDERIPTKLIEIINNSEPTFYPGAQHDICTVYN